MGKKAYAIEMNWMEISWPELHLFELLKLLPKLLFLSMTQLKRKEFNILFYIDRNRKSFLIKWIVAFCWKIDFSAKVSL